MNPRPISIPPPDGRELAQPLLYDLPHDKSRGSLGMLLTITTEAMLFVCLFFAYFYLGRLEKHWPVTPPKLQFAIPLLIILVVSSVTIYFAEERLKKGAHGAARALLLVTLGLGIVFIIVQFREYLGHLKEVTPRTNAYGSLFYIITTFHGLHVVAGLLMLGFAASLVQLDPPHSPHRPLHNAAMYWHFVDAVWVCVVVVLYILPHWTRLP